MTGIIEDHGLPLISVGGDTGTREAARCPTCRGPVTVTHHGLDEHGFVIQPTYTALAPSTSPDIRDALERWEDAKRRKRSQMTDVGEMEAVVDDIFRAALRAAPVPRPDLAGHRIDGEHDCFAMNCKALGPEVERLRERLRAASREPIDADVLGMALDMVDDEDQRVGVLNRGRKVDRVIAKYAAILRGESDAV